LSALRPILVLVLAALLAIAWIGCDRPPGHGGGSGPVLAAAADSSDAFSTVAPFALTERSGRTVLREDLLGKPWVAAFVFTRCSGPCPKVTGTMRRLQDRLPKESAARLVSLSVDPEWDTPEVLSEYANGVGADPERWWFLTGPEKTIDELILKSFLSPVERASGADVPVGIRVSHRTQLVVVDRSGRVRGFYAGESDADLDLILARLEFLEREPAPR
jgi:protein SCO1